MRHSEHVEERDGSYYVTGPRVSLDSVVYAFKRGAAERRQEQFPVLKLSRIYGGVAFYLDHEAEIDKYLEDTEREMETNSIPISVAGPALWEQIQRCRA